MINTQQKTTHAQYLETGHWAELRVRLFHKDGHRCCGCGSQDRLQGHHANYRNYYDCTLDDLVTLCYICHKGIHDYMSESGIGHNQLSRADIISILHGNPTLEARRIEQKAKDTPTRSNFLPKGSGQNATMTKQMMRALMTRNGGYTYHVATLLGVPQPLPRGWTDALIGKTFPRELLLKAFDEREFKANVSRNIGVTPNKSQAKTLDQNRINVGLLFCKLDGLRESSKQELIKLNRPAAAKKLREMASEAMDLADSVEGLK